jgi:hypothetical protein
LKSTKSCKNASKNEIYLQEIYQSSNQEMFAISQPRSQGFSLFVIGKAGKGPGTGRLHDFHHPDIVGVINYN